MDLFRNRQAERVRQILSTRGLTFYRVSQLSVQLFGRSSAFYPSAESLPPPGRFCGRAGHLPIVALSRITNYRLRDWLAVFGFDLDVIPQLQALVARRHTVILDSSLYDRDAWIAWFADRPGAAATAGIAPLGQLISHARPQPARELLARGQTDFVYVKVAGKICWAFRMWVRAASFASTRGKRTNCFLSVKILRSNEFSWSSMTQASQFLGSRLSTTAG